MINDDPSTWPHLRGGAGMLLAWLTKQRQWGLVSGVAALEEAGPLGGGCSGYPPEALDEWMTISVKAVG